MRRPQRVVQIAVTASAVLAGAAHLIWPALHFDAATVTFALVAVVPWLAPLFKSLELPGGIKLQFQELERVQERAQEAGLLATSAKNEKQAPFAFQQIASADPNLALAGLRIEMEKRLKFIAEESGINPQRMGVGRLLTVLWERGRLTEQEHSVLADLVGLLNGAVHGAQVDPKAFEWALDVGPQILEGLDSRAEMARRMAEHQRALRHDAP